MKKKKLLTVSGIVVAYVIAVVVFYLFGMYVILPALFGPSEISEDERYVTFDDGTNLERTGGPTYIHTLPRGFCFDKGDSRFDCSIHHANGYYEYGCITRYAYDNNGNIAYRQLENSRYSGQEYLYEFDQIKVVSDRTILYNCETDTEREFNSMNELYAYCREQNIQLGAWYYPLGYTPVAETIVLTSDNWTMASNARDYCFVDNGTDELFAGYVDKYFEYENYFGFHFQHIENDDSMIEENPVIEYSTDEIVGKKYIGFIFFYNDVYVDKYVLINSETDEYTIFDTKKELTKYAKDAGIDVKWNKIKY